MPASHLEMVSLYVDLATRKRAELERTRGRLHAGLSKLRCSGDNVRELEEELAALQPKLEEKSLKAQQLLEKVTNDKTLADSIAEAVQKEQDVVNEQSSKIKALEDEAKNELDACMPEYRRAAEAIDRLDKKDIQE